MFVYFRGDTLTGGGGNIKAFPHNHKSPESCSGSSGRVHEEVSKTAPNLFLQICSNRKVNNLTEIRHASIALSCSVLQVKHFQRGENIHCWLLHPEPGLKDGVYEQRIEVYEQRTMMKQNSAWISK